MIKINPDLKPSDLSRKLERLWELSAEKINLIEKRYDASKGSPVFTAKGVYTSRGWTEWDTGVSIRVRYFAIRCHRGKFITGVGPKENG